MNKKIKSVSEILSEIDNLFQDIADKFDLTNRVVKYLKSITGKELMPEEEIKIRLMIKLRRFIENYGNKYYDKVKINEILPFEKFIKIFDKEMTSRTREMLFVEKSTLCYKIVEANHGLSDANYENNRIPDDIFRKDLKEHKELEKLNKFCLKYPYIDLYINNLIVYNKKKFLITLVKNNLAPLSSIFCLFDNFKNLRENREMFYKLLDGKFSRHTIQIAIQRELKNIKAGKFKYITFENV